MEKKIQKRSLFKILILTAITFFTGLAVLFLGLNATKRASGAEENPPVATIFLGGGGVNDSKNNVYYFEDFERGWDEVVKRGTTAYSTDPTSFVRAVLKANWTANPTSGFGTTSSFNNGRIFAPANTRIELDLNGFKLDRNLATASEYGHVLNVAGNLTIADYSTDKTGLVTGGKTSGDVVFGSAAYVNGGTFTLSGGTITGNTATAETTVYGLAVSVVNGGTFNMTGGKISNHTNTDVVTYGGGVCVYLNGQFNMTGGTITGNTAVYGGGVACYDMETGATAINVAKGTIDGNSALSGNSGEAVPGGGGICIYKHGNAIISGGEICRNTTNSTGAGIYVLGDSNTSKLTINGGRIHHNVAAATDRAVYGGGVALVKDLDKRAEEGVEISATMSGGSIESNSVIANCEESTIASGSASYQAMGGGVYLSRATFNLTSGEIKNNRVSSLLKANAETDFEEVRDALLAGNGAAVANKLVAGYKTFGGGVAVRFDPEEGSVPATTFFNMSGGWLRGNKAQSGGGFYGDGYIDLSGGSIIENFADFGGGASLASNARLTLRGMIVINENYALKDENRPSNETKYQTNLEITTINLSDERIPQIGEFEFGASVHVFMHEEIIDNGTAFTKGYGENNRKFISVDGKAPDSEEDPENGVWVYANPYNFFASDAGYEIRGNKVGNTLSKQHIVVLESGELGVARDTIKYIVTLSDGSTKEFSFGDGDGKPEWNYVEYTYGAAVYPVKLSAPDATDAPSMNITQDGTAGTYSAGVYTLQAKPGAGATTTEFSVVIKAKVLDESDVTVEVSDDQFTYEKGQKRIPSSVTVKLGQTKMSAENDYTLSYLNNENAGTATVVVSFKGNYTGTAYGYFTIGASTDTSVTMTVVWQANRGSGWVALDPNEAFTYDPVNSDQSSKIRAILTASDDSLKQAVYAKGITVADSADEEYSQNASMYIEFKGTHSEDAVAFQDADTYTMTLVNDSNYEITTANRTGIVQMNAMTLALTADDFNNDAANSGRLWQLKIATSTDPIYTNLYDNATYIENGQSKKGTLLDAYARFRNVPLSLTFNTSYKVAGSSDFTLATILQMANKFKYVNTLLDSNGNALLDKNNKPVTAETIKGTNGTVTPVRTSVELEFTSNFIVGTNNKITLTKTWYIVSMVNELLNADGTTITSDHLSGWTFGNSEELKAYTFRAEHGNTVIYTYYNSLGEQVGRFGLVYNGTTNKAIKQFYEASDSTGKLVVNKDKPINDENYLFAFNNSLRAGDYKLVITVQVEAQNGKHVHWWNGEVVDDQGTIYPDFEYEFTFTVATYPMAINGERNVGITYEIPDNDVVYTGTNNNVPQIIVRLNGKVLEEGVDYELYSDDVVVGWATLRVKGINSLAGDNAEFAIPNAFKIVKAVNGWYDVPSIMNWAYKGYKRDINLITATPILPLDNEDGLWFAISRDSNGEDIVEGLEHITLTKKGEVTQAVAAILNTLKAGEYYLIGTVEEATNYYGLNPQPIPFRVFVATNGWKTTPTVKMWTEGEYKPEGEHILSEAMFGESHIKIVGDDGKVYYDSDAGIDKLASAKAGRYTLTSYVDAAADYSGMDVYTVNFQIFEKPGVPWWATVVAVVGALGVAALVIFILWKKGVFQLLTEKIVVAIRTRASVEATIASVRAAKAMEEGKQSVADAKRRERIEKMRQRAAEQRAMSPEERAAQLEAKAQAEAARAEKLRERSEAIHAKAERIRTKDEAQKAEPEVKVDAEVTAEPEAKAEVKAEAKPKAKSGSKAKAKPAAEAEAEAKAEPEAKEDAEAKAEASKDPETPTEE